MKNVCVIFDTDEQYARKLMNVLNSRKGLMYRSVMFTDREALYGYLEQDAVQLLVISEDADLDAEKTAMAERTVVLAEDEYRAGNADSDMKSRLVYKYQPAQKLVSKIIGSGAQLPVPSDGRQIVGVYSPVHYTGKTSFSLALAKAYAKNGSRTLYINLEEFSGLSEILPDTGNGDLSDVIYLYRTDKDRFNEEFERYVCTAGNISYIPPVRCAEDLTAINTKTWMELILHIADTGIFEVLVLDAANAMGEPWCICEICSRVIMPVREDYISKQKVRDFENCMRALGREKLYQNAEKMLLPRDCGACISKDFLDMVEYGTLGKHAQEIVRRK